MKESFLELSSVTHLVMVRYRSSCPPGVFCVSAGLTTTLLILVAVGMVFFVMAFLFSSRSSLLSTVSSLNQTQMAVPPSSPVLPSSPVQISVNGGGDSRYDRAPQPARDWMAQPEFPPRGGLSRLPFNQPTKGLPESFQSIGLIRVEDKMLPLYGRRTAGSSDRWNYYTRTDTYNPIPLPVQVQKRNCMDDIGCPEVFSGEKIHVRGMQKEGETELYPMDGPKYIPGLL